MDQNCILCYYGAQISEPPEKRKQWFVSKYDFFCLSILLYNIPQLRQGQSYRCHQSPFYRQKLDQSLLYRVSSQSYKQESFQLVTIHKEEIKNKTSLSKEKIFLMECHKISMKLYPFRDWSCAWIFFNTNYLLWTTTFHGDVLISYPLDLIKSRLTYRLCF